MDKYGPVVHDAWSTPTSSGSGGQFVGVLVWQDSGIKLWGFAAAHQDERSMPTGERRTHGSLLYGP